jgi:hypothetical protein
MKNWKNFVKMVKIVKIVKMCAKTHQNISKGGGSEAL